QYPDEWIGHPMKPFQGLDYPQRRRQRLLYRQPFWRLFARRDVQKGQGGKTDDEGDGLASLRRLDVQPGHHRLEQRGEHRLAHPAQAQARQRDAQLTGAKRGVEVPDHTSRDPRPAIAPGNQWRQLRIANFHQGELRRDKKTVQKNQRGDREQFEHDGNDRFLGHFRINSRRLEAPNSSSARARTSPRAGPGGAGAPRSGSWDASTRIGSRNASMNPPLTPPRRGTDRAPAEACSQAHLPEN